MPKLLKRLHNNPKLQPQNPSRTRLACYLSLIVQAIVNNLAPMLFVTFQREFFVSLEQISALIAIIFSHR